MTVTRLRSRARSDRRRDRDPLGLNGSAVSLFKSDEEGRPAAGRPSSLAGPHCWRGK